MKGITGVRPRGLRGRLPIVVCLLGTLIPGVTWGSDLKLEASLGFDQRAKVNCWTPVFVVVENRGQRRSGRLAIDLHQDSRTVLSRITRAVTLEAPARKRFVLYVRCTAEVSEVHVRAELGSLVEARTLIPELLNETDKLQVAVFTAQASAVPRSASIAEAGPALAVPSARHRAVVTAAGLPDRWFGYDGVSTIWLGELNPQLFAPPQVDALRQWVAGGGELVALGGRFATRLRRSWLEPLLPPPGGRQPYGLGVVRLLAGEHLPELTPTSERSHVVPNFAALRDTVSLERRAGSRRALLVEWMFFLLCAVGVVSLGLGARRRRTPLALMGILLLAGSVVRWSWALVVTEAELREVTVILATPGESWASAHTVAVARSAGGGRFSVSARPGATMTRTRMDHAVGPVESVEEHEVLTLPGVRFAPEAELEFVVQSSLELRNIEVARENGRFVVTNRSRFALRHCWLSGDGAATDRGSVPAGEQAELERPRPSYLGRWQDSVRTAVEKLVPDPESALCAWIELPPQVNVGARKVDWRGLSVVILPLSPQSRR